MKTRLILIFLNFSIVIYSQGIDSALFKAYKYNSKIILDEFFSNWERSFTICNYEYLTQDDTVHEVYKILQSFYKMSGKEKYFILVDSIRYRITYSSEPADILGYKDTSIKFKDYTLREFRPFDKVENTKFLYLNEKYYMTFQEYFKMESENIDKEKKLYDNKILFLNGYLEIKSKGNVHGPGIYVGKLLTDPREIYIIFNESFNKAIIYWSMGCALMRGEYIKNERVWENLKIQCVAIC